MNTSQKKMIDQLNEADIRIIMTVICDYPDDILTDPAKETLLRYILKLERKVKDGDNK